MAITQIILENFKSFRGIHTIDLSEKINVFTGKNNSGKTSLLSSLNYFNGLSNQLEKDRNFEAEELNISIILKDIKLEKLNGFYNNKSEIETRQYIHEQFSRASSSDSCGFKISYNRQNPSSPYFYLIINNQHVIPTLPLSSIFANQLSKAFIIYISNKRNAGAISAYQSMTSYESKLDCSNTAILFDEISKNPLYGNKFKLLVEDIIGFTLNDYIYPNRTNGERCLATETSSGEKIFADSLGTGISEIAGLITYIYQAKDCVILIDEIENSLHPQALKKILDFIIDKSLNSNVQFIITTHSNIVLTHLGNHSYTKIFEFKNNSEKFTETTISEISTKEDRLNILQSLGYSLYDYYIYEYFLIVEGPSDQYYINNIIIPMYFPDLMKKLRVIVGGGCGNTKNKAKTYYDRICSFFYLDSEYTGKVFVLCDGDEIGVNTIEELKNYYEEYVDIKLNHNFITLEKNKQIEHYFPNSLITKVLDKYYPEVENLNHGFEQKKFKDRIKDELYKEIKIYDLDYSNNDIENLEKFKTFFNENFVAKIIKV